ncbi:MAG TPA: acylphosphatase [Planctomycetota bacterium]|nr:acylphosphatase [Planctomycetota bacterium]
MTEQRRTVTVRIEGRVQGVFYRAWTEEKARMLGLDGWVRNRRDGTVEVEVVGERDAVQACIERLRRGPPGADVARLEVEWVEAPAPPAARRFEIRSTG